MRRNLSVLLLIIVCALAVPAFSQTQDQKKEPVKEQPKEQAKEINVSGVWIMTVQSSQGEMPPSEVTFTQEKETLKLALSGPQGTPLTGVGTIKENVVQWTVTISGPQGDFSIAFKGKVDGENMTGDIQMVDYGTATWSATKKKT